MARSLHNKTIEQLIDMPSSDSEDEEEESDIENYCDFISGVTSSTPTKAGLPLASDLDHTYISRPSTSTANNVILDNKTNDTGNQDNPPVEPRTDDIPPLLDSFFSDDSDSDPDYLPMQPSRKLEQNLEKLKKTLVSKNTTVRPSNTNITKKFNTVVSDSEWSDKATFPQKSVVDKLDFDNQLVSPTNLFSITDPPVAYFNRFFNDQVYDLIVNETNKYARQKNIVNWTDITKDETKAFVGLLFLMGLHQLPEIYLYWSSDPLFYVRPIAEVMTVKRFKKILQALHLNDNETMPKRDSPDYDRLYKIRPLVNILNNAFQTEAIQTKCQSIDESMILFKGRSTLKQYMPLKPIKRGYKVWARCDSQSGYLYQFQIYTGKKDGSAEEGLASSVVQRLCQQLEDQECHVTFDNFYTSVDLLEKLFEKKIFCTGTIRGHRVGLPSVAREKSKMEKSSSIWLVKDHVGYVKWQDTKQVQVCSTAFMPNDIVQANRTQKTGEKKLVNCPKPIAEYTKRMGGVDRFDQKRSVYQIGRKSRRWWLRIFYFLVESCAVNAFILYCKVQKRNFKSQLQFRRRLAQGLLENFCSRKRPAQSSFLSGPKNKNPRKDFGVPDEIRLGNVGFHLPKELEKYQRCRLCSSKTNNKRSKIGCERCDVALCIVPCFKIFHE